MNNIVITEIQLAASFYRSGLLKYFNSDELAFHITDICYAHKILAINNDRLTAQKMVDAGLLKVVTLDESQMEEVERLHHFYKPKFIVKTVTALVLAKQTGFKLLSQDDLLRETAAQDFKIRAINKGWLIQILVDEISMMGENIDIELVKQII